jgi:hypothetical protein
MKSTDFVKSSDFTKGTGFSPDTKVTQKQRGFSRRGQRKLCRTQTPYYDEP